MSTRQTKSFAKINNIIKCKPYNWFFHQKDTKKNSYFGNFVINNSTKLPKIGNIVSKNMDFDPFLALAKNLTTASCPSEMRGRRKQKFWIASFLAMTRSDAESRRDGKTLSRRRESLLSETNTNNKQLKNRRSKPC